MKSVKISIVLPTYNGQRFIKESIDSILNQTEKDWELIIVNDASSDDTLTIAKDYASKDKRISVISNDKNLKTSGSLNVGFSKARGGYLTWTSDDNIFKPKALEFMAKFLDENPKIDLISCNMDEIDEKGNFIKVFANYQRSILQLITSCNVGACFMYRREIANKIGGYDQSLSNAEDYDYWCKIAANGNIFYSNENFYKYRRNSSSISANKADQVAINANIIRKRYSSELIKKYKPPYFKKAKIYYQLWRNDTGNAELLKKSLLMNPLIVVNVLNFLRKAKKRARS
jgi:glycosyltransferase involved in cell wall biosynthesis